VTRSPIARDEDVETIMVLRFAQLFVQPMPKGEARELLLGALSTLDMRAFGIWGPDVRIELGSADGGPHTRS
jgi:hypothetical protein